MRALILEDNPPLAKFLEEFLLKEGWETNLSGSWSTASCLMDKQSFDLLVLDILLPDKKGFDVLEILSQQKTNPFLKVALISGFVDEKSALKKIPENLKNRCVFFKKPIDEKAFSKFLKTVKFSELDTKEASVFEFFFESSPPSKPLYFYLSKSKTFESKDLIPAVFLAHLKQFTGYFNITIDSKNKSLIEFYKGRIIKLVSNSEKSFFGVLLVEHGLSLQKDIQTLLENKESKKPMGKRLVEKGLLSPHMLSFILKEQLKIRLSEIMSYPSFKLDIQEKTSCESGEAADIDFNEIDFIEWLADSLKTELKENHLKKLFMKIKSKKIQKSSQINKALVYQKNFLQEYNLLFKSLKNNSAVKDIINDSKNKNHTLQLLYFGLLTKSISLKSVKEEAINSKKIEILLDSIMEKESNDLFAILNLPWNATAEEAKKSYQQLVRSIHPHTLSTNSSKQLKEKCERAFYKITKSYKILKDDKKREEYIKTQKEEDFVAVMNKYEEGLTKIKQEKYKEGIIILEQILKHQHSPGNTGLYILLARLKSIDEDLTKNRKRAAEIKRNIDLCPISLKTSPLFWYIKGLFCIKTAQYEKAKELFGKSLKIEKNFLEAKRELILLESKIRANRIKNSNKILNFFLKKSG